MVLLCPGLAFAVRVEYTVSVRAGVERVRVAAELRDLPDGDVTVAMPVWMPGYYARTDQAEGVEGLTITANGAPLTTERVSPSAWRFRNDPASNVRVEYDVRAREYGYHAGDPAMTLGQMGVYVDRESAFLHPGAALVYVLGHTDAPSTLRLNLPDGWQTTAPLPRDATGVFAAPDYHTLNDSPVQTGRFRRLTFSARGREFEVILTGKPRVKDAVITEVCRRVSEAGMSLFDGYVPFERYQFHLHFPTKRASLGAGLEHGESTVIVFGSRMDEAVFRGPGARLIAHEFLHAWNVKALHPEGLGNLEYQPPPRTPSLWLAEGVTDYLAHLVMVRGGLWAPRRALESFGALADAYRASAGRNATSLVAASEGVGQMGGASNGSGGTNYYTKGLLAAWLLDTEIRAITGGRKGLDDALRHMMRAYAEKGKPYPPDALLPAIKEACGVDVTETYRAAVHGTADLPLEKAAERMGARLTTVERPDPMLGVVLKQAAGGPIVEEVVKGSAADRAGIRKGDALFRLGPAPVAAAAQALLASDGQPLLAGRAVGDRVQIMVQRGIEKEIVTVIVQGRPATALERVKDPTPAEKAVWEGLWGASMPGE